MAHVASAALYLFGTSRVLPRHDPLYHMGRPHSSEIHAILINRHLPSIVLIQVLKVSSLHIEPFSPARSCAHRKLKVERVLGVRVSACLVGDDSQTACLIPLFSYDHVCPSADDSVLQSNLPGSMSVPDPEKLMPKTLQV